MSLEDDIERERESERKLRILAVELAESCTLLWNRGDGDGGYVLSVIRNAFYDVIGHPNETVSNIRKRDLSRSVKKAVLERDAYRCVSCSSHINLCVDHIYPWSLGGGNDMNNLQTLCWTCNSKKSNKIEGLENE